MFVRVCVRGIGLAIYQELAIFSTIWNYTMSCPFTQVKIWWDREVSQDCRSVLQDCKKFTKILPHPFHHLLLPSPSFPIPIINQVETSILAWWFHYSINYSDSSYSTIAQCLTFWRVWCPILWQSNVFFH